MAVVSIKNKTKSGSLLVGNEAFYPDAFESIATVTVGSGGSASAEFTSIPSTYAHLQIRFFVADTSTNHNFLLTTNSSSATRGHQLMGDGATATSDGSWTSGIIYSQRTNTGQFVGVVDILDYANTNKNKTVRCLAGGDKNGAGRVNLTSNFRDSTTAISSLSFAFSTGNIPQYSHFALYGIKGA
jgi:hypothetical protein